MRKPLLLDLFCCAGGAAKGFMDAGFYVVGVDNKPQPRYIGDEFHQADALTFPLEGFDVIHASPPCKMDTRMKHLRKAQGTNPTAPRLVEETRARLSGRNYVIENVPGAPLLDPTVLCGSSFGLRVRRHRLFETSIPLLPAPPCQHKEQGRPVGVWNWGSWGHEIPNGGKSAASLEDALDAMGIDWRMTRAEVSEAVPPIFTEWIGKQFMEHILWT